MTETMPGVLTIDHFAPLVGKDFTADCDPKAAILNLVEAAPLTDRGVVARPPFILVFFTPPETRLLAGSYHMQCGNFGPAQIYIEDMVPPPGSEAGYYYQAVFN